MPLQAARRKKEEAGLEKLNNRMLESIRLQAEAEAVGNATKVANMKRELRSALEIQVNERKMREEAEAHENAECHRKLMEEKEAEDAMLAREERRKKNALAKYKRELKAQVERIAKRRTATDPRSSMSNLEKTMNRGLITSSMARGIDPATEEEYQLLRTHKASKKNLSTWRLMPQNTSAPPDDPFMLTKHFRTPAGTVGARTRTARTTKSSSNLFGLRNTLSVSKLDLDTQFSLSSRRVHPKLTDTSWVKRSSHARKTSSWFE